MSYDMKKMSRARKEIKDIEYKGKMYSIEQIERKAKAVEDKRSKLLREARKVLSREQMVSYIEGERKFGDIRLPKLPESLIVD